MCSLITILISFIISLPNLLTTGICIQLAHPFPFGSVVIISMFHYANLVTCLITSYLLINQVLFNSTYFLFTSIVMLVILVSTYLMFRKLGERRELNTNASSPYNTKAEKTLSVTIILILIPLVFNQVIAVSDNKTTVTKGRFLDW